MRPNWWPWYGNNVVVKNYYPPQQTYCGCGGSGMFGGWMEKMMMFNMANSFINNIFTNIRGARDGRGDAGATSLPPFAMTYAPQQQGFYPYVNFSGGGYSPYGSYSPYGQAVAQDGLGGVSQNDYALYNQLAAAKGIRIAGRNDAGEYFVVDSKGNTTKFSSWEDLKSYIEEAGTSKKKQKADSAPDSADEVTDAEEVEEPESVEESEEEAPAETENDGKAKKTPKTKRQFSKGTLKTGYSWYKFSELPDNIKTAIKRNEVKNIASLCDALGINKDNPKNKEFLLAANPTAIDDNGNIVNKEKLDVIYKTQTNNSFLSNNNTYEIKKEGNQTSFLVNGKEDIAEYAKADINGLLIHDPQKYDYTTLRDILLALDKNGCDANNTHYRNGINDLTVYKKDDQIIIKCDYKGNGALRNYSFTQTYTQCNDNFVNRAITDIYGDIMSGYNKVFDLSI